MSTELDTNPEYEALMDTRLLLLDKKLDYLVSDDLDKLHNGFIALPPLVKVALAAGTVLSQINESVFSEEGEYLRDLLTSHGVTETDLSQVCAQIKYLPDLLESDPDRHGDIFFILEKFSKSLTSAMNAKYGHHEQAPTRDLANFALGRLIEGIPAHSATLCAFIDGREDAAQAVEECLASFAQRQINNHMDEYYTSRTAAMRLRGLSYPAIKETLTQVFLIGTEQADRYIEADKALNLNEDIVQMGVSMSSSGAALDPQLQSLLHDQ